MSKRDQHDDSTIPVRAYTTHLDDVGIPGAGVHENIYVSVKTRGTEAEALARMRHVPTLKPVHERLLVLEQIGKCPYDQEEKPTFPFVAVHNRPRRPLAGRALYLWIGGHVNLDWQNVQTLLEESDLIYQARAVAGWE